MHLGRLLIAPYLHAHPLKATKNKQKRERKRGTQHKFYNKNMVNAALGHWSSKEILVPSPSHGDDAARV